MWYTLLRGKLAMYLRRYRYIKFCRKLTYVKSVILEQVIYSTSTGTGIHNLVEKNGEFYQRIFVSNSFRMRASRIRIRNIFPDPTPDLLKSFGSDQIRLRIHNTAFLIQVLSGLK